MKIGNIAVNDSSRAFLIAEIGHNHQGNLKLCIEMITAAAAAGADAVKLQKRSNKEIFTKNAYSQPYNSENAFGETYGLHREALEFGKHEFLECIRVANDVGVLLFATAFDQDSADFLVDVGVPAFKIASGDLRSIQLIDYVTKLGLPTIISTGGSSLEDIDLAVQVATSNNPEIGLLQCTAGYPPEYVEINLKVIETFRARYPQVIVGYSGHDSGIAIAAAAYSLGARIIEKHFTLNRTLKGTDHAFSLEPVGFRKLRRDLDRIFLALGDGVKRMYSSEEKPIKKMAKMIVAKGKLSAGQIVDLDSVAFKSPFEGLPPNKLNLILGKRLVRDLEIDEPILESDVDR